MTTLLHIRTPEGEEYPLAFDGAVFVDATDGYDTEIDTSGLWALPGLADAHAHLTMTRTSDIQGISEEEMRANIPVNAWAHVDRGVLLILDKGGGSDVSLVSLDHDADLRPIVEVAGSMIHPAGGYMPGFGVEVEPDELVAHIRSRAATRGGWVKLVGDWPRKGLGPVANYPREILAEAVEVAHAAGARVAIHTMAHAASDAVAAGVDSIEHGPFLKPEDLRSLAARNGAWVPTIVNMLGLVEMLGADSSGGRLFSEGLEHVRAHLPLAEELGLTVLAGTDMAVPHGEVSLEALRLREFGLSDEGATRAASLSAYEYTGRSGMLSPGQQADVVFFRDNPFDDVHTLLEPALVVHRGAIIRAGPGRLR